MKTVLASAFVLLVCLLLASAEISQPQELHIAAFNIQVLGQSKMDKPDVVNVLTDIIRQFDCVLVQEIRDSSETAIFKLVDEVNKQAPGDYTVTVGPRLGRSNSKEQYAFVYRTAKLVLTSQATFNDKKDDFERPPFMAQFRTHSDTLITMVGLHSKPDDAVAELDAMDKVLAAAKTFSGNDNIILMGDFNADCSYVTKSEFSQISIFNDPTLTSFIDTGVDTTTGNTHCAYDRIMTTDALTPNVIGYGVYHYDTRLNVKGDLVDRVSDHYPVYIVLESEALEWKEVYYTGFEQGLDNFWSDTPQLGTLPNGESFLGEYGEDDFVRLILSEKDLPADAQLHEYRISFLLYTIGTWNGRGSSGPDSFKILNDRSTLLETSFCNSAQTGSDRQDYPEDLNQGSSPCTTGALQTNNLGFKSGSSDKKDATYLISERFFIKTPEVRLRFSGRLVSSSGFESITSESWGIDEVYLEWTTHHCDHARKRFCEFEGYSHEKPLDGQTVTVVITIDESELVFDEESSESPEVQTAEAVRAQTAAMIVTLLEYVTLTRYETDNGQFSVTLHMYEDDVEILQWLIDSDVPELAGTVYSSAKLEVTPFVSEQDSMIESLSSSSACSLVIPLLATYLLIALLL